MCNCLLAAFDDGPQYALYASTAREAEEWIIVLQQTTYVYVCLCASMTAKCRCIDTNICYHEWQNCVVGYYRLPERYSLPAYNT